MSSPGSFNAEHVPEREFPMGASEEDRSSEAQKRDGPSSSSSFERTPHAIPNSHPPVSSFVAVADVARFAQALLVCQICKKFTTFSYKGFQSHMRKQHAGSIPGESVIGSRRSATGRIKRKLFINSKKSRPHQKNLNSTIPRSYLPISESSTSTSAANGMKCPHCNFRANKVSNLSIHIKRKHSDEVSPHKFHCTKCSLNTASRSLFQKHLLESKHFDQKCQICLEVFAEIPPYLDHLSQHYNLSPRSSMVQLNNDQTSSENAVKSLHEALQETVLIESTARSASLNIENQALDLDATSALSSSSPEFQRLNLRKSRLSKSNSLYCRSNSVCTSQVFLTLSEDPDNVMDTQLQSGSISKSKSEQRVESVVSGGGVSSLLQGPVTGTVERSAIEGLVGEDAMNVDCEATSDATTQTHDHCFTQQATTHWPEELMLTNTEADVDDMRMDVVTNQPPNSCGSTTISTQTESSSGLSPQETSQAMKSTSNSDNFFNISQSASEQGLFRLVPVLSTPANQIGGISSNDVTVSSSVGGLAAANDSSALQQYTCVHCDIIFKDKVLYTMHKGSHGFNDPFTCNLCGTELKDKYAFAAHFHCH